MIDISKIKITTLSENTAADLRYIAEWGLSFHIEIEGGPTFMFDTGGGLSCVYNADVAGIRLSDIDMILLSHGHADHTGGLRSVLQRIHNENPQKGCVATYCHPAALEPQFIIKPDRKYYFQGCPYSVEELVSLGADFITSPEAQWLGDDVILSGEIPMQTDFESIAPILFLKRKGEYIDSPVDDDQAVFLKTNKGLLIIAGCAHRGIINTIMHAKKITGMENIFMVVGGTHLVNTSDLQQQMTLESLNAFGVEKIGVSHCTGMKAAGFLACNLGFDRFFYNNAGTQITFKDDRTVITAFEKYQ